MHYNDIEYFRCKMYLQHTSIVHDLHSNFNKFFDITNAVFNHRVHQFDNFIEYRNRPKRSDCQIIALVVTDISLGIDSESYF
jgi:hypothetical protein